MADAKLTALAALTPVGTDITYVVSDPGGTPISKKATINAVALAANNPCCSVSLSTPQTVNSGTPAAMVFDAADTYDTDTMHDPSSNNTRISATTAGAYIFSGSITFVASATGQVTIVFKKNGTTQLVPILSLPNSAAITPALSHTQGVKLAAADYIEMMCYHSNGTSMSITIATCQASRTGIG